MLDRDIEDTRQPKDDGVDTDELWAQVQDCLSKELYEFVQDEFEEAARERYHWLRQWRAVSKDLAALKEQTRWIPIGERLPSIPFYDRYAVLCSGDYLVATFFAGTNEWRYRGQTIYGVSHWMTIPESPELDA